MNHTPNYQLSQWAKSDRVLMDDFNADNAKIDAALAGLDDRADTIAASVPDIRFGSYTGDDVNGRVIHLGYTPKAVLLMISNGRTFIGAVPSLGGGLFFQGHPLAHDHGARIAAEIVEGGFKVYAAFESGNYNI